MKNKAEKYIKRILTYFSLAISAAIFIFPIIWLISTSFKSRLDVFAIPPKFLFMPILENYGAIFQEYSFGQYVLNSLIIVAPSLALSTFIGSLAGYSLARFKIRGGDFLAFQILGIRLFPPVVTIIPIYLIINTLGLLDTHLALILMYTLIDLPLVVWVMRTFFREIPIEIEEAAMVDGCSSFDVFRKIVLPLVRPGLLAVLILNFMLSWNEFFFAFILGTTNARTAAVATISFVSERGIRWGETCAAATTFVAPVLAVVFLVQKQIIRGLTFGAVKA